MDSPHVTVQLRLNNFHKIKKKKFQILKLQTKPESREDKQAD